MQQTSFSNGLLWVAAVQSGPTPYFVKPESGYTSKYICMHNQQSSGSSAHGLLCGQVPFSQLESWLLRPSWPIGFPCSICGFFITNQLSVFRCFQDIHPFRMS